MPTLTSNFGFQKPLVNNATDADLWGGQLNANWDSIDTKVAHTTSSKVATFSVGATEFNYVYLVDTSAGDVTANLPAVADVFNGFTVYFKVTDATNDLIIDGNGSETIDGATTVTFSAEDQYIGLVTDGTEWYLHDILIATQAEAEAGTVNDKYMTPLRTSQAISALVDIATTISGSGVGAMVFAETNTASTYSRGDTISGSNLKASSATTDDPSPPSLTGTWTCLGYSTGGGPSSATMWIRTS
jgi:hypothetical protein